MKIALVSTQVITSPPGEGYGGLERVVWDLAEVLDGLGHEVDLFAAPGSKKPSHGKLWEGANPEKKEIPEGLDPDRASLMRWLPKSKEEAASGNFPEWDKYQVVHDHSWTSLFLKMKADGINKHYLSTLHAPDLGVPLGEFIPAVKPCIVGISYTHANILMSNGQTLASGVAGVWPHRARTVYNGINFGEWTPRDLAERGDFYLWINRLFKPKGALDAIEACKKAGVKLVVAGGSPGDQWGSPGHKEEVEQACKDAGYPFLGHVPDAKRKELMNTCRGVLMPHSWPEPFGLVAVESMACGTPVLAFSSGGLAEIVEHGVTGYLGTNIGELREWLQDLDHAYRNGGVPFRAQEIRAHAQLRFSREVMARAYLRLYDLVAKNVEW